MENKYVIITGKCKEVNGQYRDIWDEPTYLKHYFNNKCNAEIFLANNGYVKDEDDVFFLGNEGYDLIAKIVRLSSAF